MTDSTPRDGSHARVHATRSDGQASRQAILHEAAQLATVEGLTGLSIARLASAVGMSKSGLFAHFGSKEDLQLATIQTASEVFAEQVVDPSVAEPTGYERLLALLENFLRHVERAVYPGGCFFASIAAEMDTHPGPVRDQAIQLQSGWLALLAGCIRDAQGDGRISTAEEPEQLAFELNSYLLQANALFVVEQTTVPTNRARTAIQRRLAAAA